MRKNWKERYSAEVEKMTLRYEGLNKCANTITRKPTPEEEEYYRSVFDKPRNIHGLTYLKGER